MLLNEVLKRCEEKGHPMTAIGLYRAGEKFGFITKESGKHYKEFNKEKFNTWLKKALEEVPEGWVNVKELSKMVNLSVPQIYLILRTNDCGVKQLGAGNGKKYVDPKRFEEIINKRKERDRIEWED